MRESRRTRQFLNTSPSSSYFTLARGGYIMRINPMAMGILVVPTWNWFQKSTTPGNTKPQPTPMNMARKIHSVKNLSRKESFLLSCSVAICLPPCKMTYFFRFFVVSFLFATCRPLRVRFAVASGIIAKLLCLNF